MSGLPTGTVTFLFTDLGGSTRLWEEHADAMRGALARHDAILREAIAAHGGHVVKTTGDGVHASFATAREGVDAAVASQLALGAEVWEITGALRVRMGLHTCEAELRDGDYYGSSVNRAARLMSVAYPGQVLCTQATADLVRERLPPFVGLLDLGCHWLRDLDRPEEVFQVTHPDLGAEFPPLSSLDAVVGNLPRQVTSFIGRERELASLAELVREASLVTLTGVGGVGKTRLAIRVAAEVVADFPDGAWLCEFAPVTDPSAVWETLAASLRVQPFQGRTLEESVLAYLASKRALVIFDNCEHLLDAVARQVDVVLHRCSRLVVLATSREGLALAGERIVAVPSLRVPAAGTDDQERTRTDAVRLFVDRASATRPDFTLTDRNADAVAVLCRRLDGIPLAIELAAARVRSMSPEDLAARLDQRFKLLTQGSRAALERHQTLRNTIDWSYELLDRTGRQVLNGLSVFAGGCDLAAAEAVLPGVDLDASGVADVLGQLVDKSLAVVDDSGDGSTRYSLLETIRQYAREQLEASGETANIRRRHAEHYVSVAETAGPHLRSRSQTDWAVQIAREADNFRVALDWAVETQSSTHALRLVAPLAVSGLPIGDLAQEWAATASAIPGGALDPLLPAVAAWGSQGAAQRGDYTRAEELLALAENAEAATATRSPHVSMARASLAFRHGDYDQAQRHGEEWATRAAATNDDYELAYALVYLGTALGMGNLGNQVDDATATLDHAVRVAREVGIDSVVARSLVMLAFVLPIEESDRALALIDEAIETGTRIGDRMTIATATLTKSGIAARRGAWQTALEAGLDAAEQLLRIGDLQAISGSIAASALALCELGHFEPAAILLGKADSIANRFWLGWALVMVEATDAALTTALGSEHAAALAAQGAALTTSDAVAYLRSETDQLILER